MSGETAISVVEKVGQVAALAAKIGNGALPIAEFIAGFFPGAAPVIQVLKIAAPIFDKIVAAAPIVKNTIERSGPLIEAVELVAPEFLGSLKQLYAIAVNHDPKRPEVNMTADDVTTEQAMDFGGPILLGRRWTNEETQRWWDRMSGAQGL